MAYRQMHLNKSGTGLGAKTACGRNLLRTPMSCAWAQFKATPVEQQCSKCADSKHVAVRNRMDLTNSTPAELAEDDAIERFHRDMSNSICDGDRKWATKWLAERINDPVRAERMRRDWMLQR